MKKPVSRVVSQEHNRELISAKQTARMLGVHPNTLCKWRIRGIGPRYMKIGQKIIYRVSDIDDWLGRRTYDNTTQYGNDHGKRG